MTISFDSFAAEPFYRERGTAIGMGRVGGKAKGLAYAQSIVAGSPLDGVVRFPDLTYVLTTELFDEYISTRGLSDIYEDDDWERVFGVVCGTPLQESAVRELERALRRFDEIGAPPIAVRSSSLLEDSINLAFAGKYLTEFEPNVGSFESRLASLEQRVRYVYASLFCPSARAYREKHGRRHRDESMAVLLQSLDGRDHDGMFYPELAGTIFSRVFRRPSPRIKKEDGLIRLCFGLGTRSVDRCAARTIYLTNPSIRSEGTMPANIAYSSQEYFDYIDRKNGAFATGWLSDEAATIRRAHKNFSAYVEYYADNFLYSAFAEPECAAKPVFSFPELHVRERGFFDTARALTSFMESTSGLPMDMEFTYEPHPNSDFRLVQMRPLASFAEMARVTLPEMPDDRVLFRGDRMVTNGKAEDVTHLVFVDPHKYRSDWRPSEVARALGEINSRLAGKRYILVGPGRWGSRNPLQGVPVVYAEICGTCCLVEISVPSLRFAPELSFGTHFFLDMDSDGILYLPVFSGQRGNVCNWDMLDAMPYAVGGHPAVRVYEGSFAVYLDGETESGIVAMPR